MRTLVTLLALVAAVLVAGCATAGSAATQPPRAAPPPAQAEGLAYETVTEGAHGRESVPVQAAPSASVAPESKTRKVVALDAGHGGDEVGSAANGVVEKMSNLDMALRVEKLLLAQGVDVVLTRREDRRTAPQIAGYTAARSDIQARIDLANAAGADVFVSLHSNGSTDITQKGVEVWYDSERPFSAENLRLARLLKSHVLSALSAYGYPAQDRGLFDGSCFRLRNGRCFTLFVLGGPRETTRQEVLNRGGDPEALGFNGAGVIYSEPARMPGALVELLIITNAADAAILRTDSARDAMAQGIGDAILEFLSGSPAGE